MILAHGVGSRTDLPVPRALALYGAGLAVIVSFLTLLLLWREPKLRGAAGGRTAAGTPRKTHDQR
ncbi:MAG: hypothetical protein H7323_02315 [Frankiales bacterium]|nr:hypothetical protein [Frankiales bacterium]